VAAGERTAVGEGGKEEGAWGARRGPRIVVMVVVVVVMVL
jgi:hypothetical protein